MRSYTSSTKSTISHSSLDSGVRSLALENKRQAIITRKRKKNSRHLCQWKEMFHLTTHSTHFYLQLYGVEYMVTDYLDSESGNPLLPHGLLFLINSKGSFICTITHTGLDIPWPFLHHWLEREIAQRVHFMKDRSDDPSHHERTLLPQSSTSRSPNSMGPP